MTHEEKVEHAAQMLQMHNSLAQSIQCLAAGRETPEMPQFMEWENLSEVEKNYVRAIADSMIIALEDPSKDMRMIALDVMKARNI